MMAMIDRQKAADLLDNLIGMFDDSNGNDYDAALRLGIDALRADVADTDISAYSDKLWRLAYEGGKAESVRWIPVTERLPDNDNKVLCCTVTAKGLRNVIIGYYADRWCCGMNSNVIAWMPLPGPYKDGD